MDEKSFLVVFRLSTLGVLIDEVVLFGLPTKTCPIERERGERASRMR